MRKGSSQKKSGPSSEVRSALHPILVLEDLTKVPRQKLFRAFGIDWLGTPYWWIGPLWMTAAGIGIAQWLVPDSGVVTGVIYGCLLWLSMMAHGLGHLAAGRWVGQPMQAMLMTATRSLTIYDGTRHPSRVHVVRAAGGPVANLALGLSALVVYLFSGSHYLQYLGFVNLFICMVAMAPIPTLDGGVFVREGKDWRPG